MRTVRVLLEVLAATETDVTAIRDTVTALPKDAVSLALEQSGLTVVGELTVELEEPQSVTPTPEEVGGGSEENSGEEEESVDKADGELAIFGVTWQTAVVGVLLLMACVCAFVFVVSLLSRTM